MRLQLTSAVVVLAGIAAPLALAGDIDVSARTDVYADEWITVLKQGSAASFESEDGLRVGGHYTVDVISGATRAYAPDAVSGATVFRETRLEGGLVVGAKPWRDVTVNAGYTGSYEPDYSTNSISLGGEAEVFQRMTTVGAQLNVSVEQLGRVDVPSFSEDTLASTLDVTVAQVVTKGTLVQALVSTGLGFCGPDVGCRASPYRYVPVTLEQPEGDDITLALPEHHPAQRWSGAAGLRLSQSIRPGLAAHGGYRGYVDTWGVQGHTVDVALAFALAGERVLGRLSARSSLQSAASFYDPDPSVAQGDKGVSRFRTADAELAGLHNLLLGAHLSYTTPPWLALPPLTASARIAHLSYRYPTFRALPAREAWLVGAGLGARF